MIIYSGPQGEITDSESLWELTSFFYESFNRDAHSRRDVYTYYYPKIFVGGCELWSSWKYL